MTPLCDDVMMSNSLLHHQGDAVCWTEDRLHSLMEGHGVCDREFSKLITEHVFILFKNVIFSFSADLVEMWAQCDKSQVHTPPEKKEACVVVHLDDKAV